MYVIRCVFLPQHTWVPAPAHLQRMCTACSCAQHSEGAAKGCIHPCMQTTMCLMRCCALQGEALDAAALARQISLSTYSQILDDGCMQLLILSRAVHMAMPGVTSGSPACPAADTSRSMQQACIRCSTSVRPAASMLAPAAAGAIVEGCGLDGKSAWAGSTCTFVFPSLQTSGLHRAHSKQREDSWSLAY